MAVHLVWLKRDLRLEDHYPLIHALRNGPTMLIYIAEPTLWRQPDVSAQHWEFIRESLLDLDTRLRAMGQPHASLHLLVGEAPQVLEVLHKQIGIAALYAHEETGNGFTYARDQAVRRWARRQGIVFHEVAQFAVVRGLKDRDEWLAHHKAFMGRSLAPWPPPFCVQWAKWPYPAPEGLWPVAWWLEPEGNWRAGPWPTWSDWGLSEAPPPLRQRGDRRAAWATLRSFLNERAAHYVRGISSPSSAQKVSSRLSPYLAYGLLSMREVWQAVSHRLESLEPTPAHRPLRDGILAFQSRLYWHCHFIQKLESEPEIEYRCFHQAYEDLRSPEPNPEYYNALLEGRTGWPLVDACIAMLRSTGWINFRMRAMIVSVAAYPLWLHWRPVGLWLARLFLDYEPGIHWPQLQMQSGTTGINTIRIYNPIKQAMQLDPQGEFVRHWLPYMRRVPRLWIYEPWRMPADVQRRYGLQVGRDIPTPITDLERATQQAKERIFALRACPEHQRIAQSIIRRHGSRPGMPSGRDEAGREPPPRRRRIPPDLPALF